jgi:hypothetical protein
MGYPVDFYASTFDAKKTLIVSQTSLGTKAKRWTSIQTAIDNADSGDTVVVMPGIYDESITLKHNVGLHFVNGAKVIYTGDQEFVFSDGGAYQLKSEITGHGYFEYNGSIISELTSVFRTVGESTTISVRAKSIINNTNGNVSQCLCIFRFTMLCKL